MRARAYVRVCVGLLGGGERWNGVFAFKANEVNNEIKRDFKRLQSGIDEGEGLGEGLKCGC